MQNYISAPKKRESAWLWLYKIVAGLFIVIMLGVHFVVNHLVAPTGLLTYDDVIHYYRSPVVPWMELAFLVLVVSHALVGLRSIILDLNPSDRLLRVVDIAFWVVGAGFTIYGAWLIWVIVQKGGI